MNKDEEKKINQALADEIYRLGKNINELRRDLTNVVLAAVADARYPGPEDFMGNSKWHTKGYNVELVDDAILVEWTDDGERTERFSIEVKPLL